IVLYAEGSHQGFACVKLADLYARPGLTLSVEFFPPKTDKGEENLFNEIEIIKRLNPAFCSVTYGAGGSTREKTVDLVDRIHRESCLEVMCHLTVVAQSKDEARSILKKLKYMRDKIDAGAVAIITQLFFDNDDYYRYVEDVRKLGITVPIVPGVLPILSAPQVRRFTALCCAKIPAPLERELAKVENDDDAAVQLGIEYASRQCEALIKFGAPGIHFYSLNKSLSLRAICKNLCL